jgi:choline-glycine betaine transporter
VEEKIAGRAVACAWLIALVVGVAASLAHAA